jgi:hypothetical protein
MDLLALFRRLMADGLLAQVANNPAAAYTDGRARVYLGPSLLPERRTENAFTDYGVRFRTVIANDGTRYSPAQLKRTRGWSASSRWRSAIRTSRASSPAATTTSSSPC